MTVADLQLHCILRLCHPDTSHKDAAQWIQKLGLHNLKHVDECARIVENQVMALGDLAIIVSFMHTLSSFLAMPTRSKKSGLLFTGRTAKLDAEVGQLRDKADFGDRLVPMGNILEPGVAGNALQALNDFVVEQVGAGLGSLYEDTLRACLDDVEEKCLHAKARFDKTEAKAKKFVPPPPAPDTGSTALNVAQAAGESQDPRSS